MISHCQKVSLTKNWSLWDLETPLWIRRNRTRRGTEIYICKTILRTFVLMMAPHEWLFSSRLCEIQNRAQSWLTRLVISDWNKLNCVAKGRTKFGIVLSFTVIVNEIFNFCSCESSSSLELQSDGIKNNSKRRSTRIWLVRNDPRHNTNAIDVVR